MKLLHVDSDVVIIFNDLNILINFRPFLLELGFIYSGIFNRDTLFDIKINSIHNVEFIDIYNSLKF